MPEQNQEIAKKIYEAFNNRTLKAVESFIDDSCKWNVFPFGTSFDGKPGFSRYMQNWLSGFPDAKVKIDSILASNDQVVLEYTGRGTNAGKLEGPAGTISPTGASVTLRCCDVIRFKSGKIVSTNCYFDGLSLMKQLGAGAAYGAQPAQP
jgi:steroid delta-isomerase-like uncharacterized protein